MPAILKELYIYITINYIIIITEYYIINIIIIYYNIKQFNLAAHCYIFQDG